MKQADKKQKALATWFNQIAAGQVVSMQDALAMLGDDLPWLQRLAETPQDSIWHAEGDVLIHCQMVLDELYKILSTDRFTAEERLVLVLAVILHDIAKPETTRTKEISGVERIVATGHEELGMAYLAPRVADWPLSPTLKIWLIGLVGAHQKPKLLVVREQGEHAYFNLARQAPLHLFYYLEQADMRGRTCDDLDSQLELLELFKLYAKEFACWQVDVEQQWASSANLALADMAEKPKEFLRLHSQYCFSQGLIKQAEEGISIGYGQRESHGHLIILVGASGSGKSTWIKQTVPDYQVISLDELREEINGDRQDQSNFGTVIREAKKRLKAALAAGQNVVWDATSLRLDFRTPLVDIAIAYKAKVSIVCFWIPLAKLKQQNQARRYTVPDDVLEKQLYTWQWPLPSEAHQLIYVGLESGS